MPIIKLKHPICVEVYWHVLLQLRQLTASAMLFLDAAHNTCGIVAVDDQAQ
ncbi:MAG: hypothetical protein ACN6OV_06385 [Acinetobacter sp.]|uniref:hypothetical protein n=1 Tax=Acinetobacter sp. TaxID=472 RepID=UPI003D05FC99